MYSWEKIYRKHVIYSSSLVCFFWNYPSSWKKSATISLMKTALVDMKNKSTSSNTLFTMYLGGFKSYLNTKIPALNCDPELTYSKEDAYKDHMKGFNGNDKDKP